MKLVTDRWIFKNLGNIPLDIPIDKFYDMFDRDKNESLWWSQDPQMLVHGAGFELCDQEDWTAMCSHLKALPQIHVLHFTCRNCHDFEANPSSYLLANKTFHLGPTSRVLGHSCTRQDFASGSTVALGVGIKTDEGYTLSGKEKSLSSNSPAKKMKNKHCIADPNPLVKIHGRSFNDVQEINTYVASLDHGATRLDTQIAIIDRLTNGLHVQCSVAAKFVDVFKKDQSWKACHWTVKQFDDLVQPILELEQTSKSQGRNGISNSLATIASNWGADVAEICAMDKGGDSYYRRLASVSTVYKNRYDDARLAVNNVIISRILAKANKKSSKRYASLMDWTVVLNNPVPVNSPPPIPDKALKKTRVCIGKYGILKAGLGSGPDADDGDSASFDSSTTCEDNESNTFISKNKLRRSPRTVPGPQKPDVVDLEGEQSNHSKLDQGKTGITSGASDDKSVSRPWVCCTKCKNVSGMPEQWRIHVENPAPVDLQFAMCLLSVMRYSRQEFELCDEHLTMLGKRLSLVPQKSTILRHRFDQLWEHRSSHYILRDFVLNNREWFVADMIFKCAPPVRRQTVTQPERFWAF